MTPPPESPAAPGDSPDEAVAAVTNLADHFDAMRRRVADLRTRIGARQRGYFTPSEDDGVRHLLVSYWQARAALFDLVTSMQAVSGDAATGEADRCAAFLVGYAAALLLVDAARFMRESFDDSAAIRAKLNEPEPYFGIPVGVYDTVQRSLTDPAHAWGLYQATRQFDERRPDFVAAAAQNAALAPVLAVVDRLQERVRVPVNDYIRARLRERGRQVADGARHAAIGRLMYTVQELASRMVSQVHVKPGHRPAVPEAARRELRAVLRPGDVLVTRKEHALTNYFLPGFWPHAALFLGDAGSIDRLGIRRHERLAPHWDRLITLDPAEPGRVVEALKDGVRLRSLASPLASDAVAVIRPRLPAAQIADALTRGLFHEGKPYDFDFDFTRSDRLVCTEVVYRSYEGVGGVRFTLTRRAGRLTLAAEDLLAMALRREHFEPVAVFCPGRAVGVVQDEATFEQVMRQTMAPAVQSSAAPS